MEHNEWRYPEKWEAVEVLVREHDGDTKVNYLEGLHLQRRKDGWHIGFGEECIVWSDEPKGDIEDWDNVFFEIIADHSPSPALIDCAKNGSLFLKCYVSAAQEIWDEIDARNRVAATA